MLSKKRTVLRTLLELSTIYITLNLKTRMLSHPVRESRLLHTGSVNLRVRWSWSGVVRVMVLCY